jgi:hypothetical protein
LLLPPPRRPRLLNRPRLPREKSQLLKRSEALVIGVCGNAGEVPAFLQKRLTTGSGRFCKKFEAGFLLK